MARLSAVYAIGFLFLLARTVPAADSIRVLISQLDSDDYAVREDAQRVLRQLGESAKADLRATAEKAANVEVAARVKLVLEQIDKDISEKSKQRNESRAVTRAYYVKDLLSSPGEFTGPSLVFGNGIDVREQRNNKDDRPERLIEVIKAMVEPRSWESDQFNAMYFHDVIVVRQTPEAQERIAALLDALRGDIQPRMAVSCVLVNLKHANEKDFPSKEEFEQVLRDADSKDILLQARLLCTNLKRAVAMDGKQIEYISETFYYNSEGGGGTSGVRSSQCLQGSALSVMPRINPGNGNVDMEVRLFHTSDLSMRQISDFEEWIMGKAQPAPGAPKAEGKEGAESPAKSADAKKTDWHFPSSNLESMNIDVAIPKDTWTCVGRMEGLMSSATAKEKNKDGRYVFIKVEMLDAPKAVAAGDATELKP